MKKKLDFVPPVGVSEVVRDHWVKVNFVLSQTITIVTTVDGSGRINAALKSWAIYCTPGHIMVGCNVEHETARNIPETASPS